MALGLTRPLAEMSTWNFPGGKGQLMHKADNLTVICESTVQKMWEPQLLTTLWAPQPVTGIVLPFLLFTLIGLSNM
jgi:hypothetical protein